MPMVQATDVPSAPPGGLPQAGQLPDAYQHIQSTAASFGALEGSALEQLGGTIGKAADTFAERAIDLQKIHNATTVEDASTQYKKASNDLLFGTPDKPGFYSTKGKEAQYQWPIVNKSLDDVEKNLMGGLQNDAQRLAFQRETRYDRRWMDRDISSHYQKELTKAEEHSVAAAHANAVDTAGLYYQSDDRFKDALIEANRRATYEGHGEPNRTEELRRKYSDQAYLERVEGYTSHDDWAGAAAFLEKNIDKISDNKLKETLNNKVRNKSIDANLSSFYHTGKFLVPSESYSGAGGGGNFFDRIVNQGERSAQTAVSPMGAIGKAQVLPDTAKEMSAELGIPYDENRLRTDEQYNLQLGRRYANKMLDRYGGNEVLAAAAYNAGPARVDQWIKEIGDPRGGLSNKEFAEKIPIAETREYVRRVGADTAVVEGQGNATRNLPLAPTMKGWMERGASSVGGITVEVFSGGQPSSGPNRTGSHRHDEGGAADVQLRDNATGLLLDMRKPQDRARMQQFITGTIAAGATGVGAAEDYMGPHGIHIGGGTPAAWGGDGTSATAPGWVRAAFEAGRAAPATRTPLRPTASGAGPQELSGSPAELAAFYDAVRKKETTPSQFDQWLTAYRAKAAPGGTSQAAPAAPAALDLVPIPDFTGAIGGVPPAEPEATSGGGVPTVDAASAGSDSQPTAPVLRVGGALAPKPMAVIPSLTQRPDPMSSTTTVYVPPIEAPATPSPQPAAEKPLRDIEADIAAIRAQYPNPYLQEKALEAYKKEFAFDTAVRQQQHQAKVDLSEKAQKEYADRLATGDYAGVLDSLAKGDPRLLGSTTTAIMNMAHAEMRRAEEKWPKTLGPGFYDVLQRITNDARSEDRITDSTQIYSLAGPSNWLTIQGANQLTEILTSKSKTSAGHADAMYFDQLFKAAHARLAFTGLESIGIKDDQGEMLHSQFIHQALPVIDKLKKEGVPMSEITDLDKGPLKPILDTLVRSPATIMQNFTTRMNQMRDTPGGTAIIPGAAAAAPQAPQATAPSATLPPGNYRVGKDGKIAPVTPPPGR